MDKKMLMKGNEAIAEAAIRAGCRFFFGYPITPQNEIPAYMAKRMREVSGCYLQAESEISAISMVYGAAGAGARVMTSSSSPGISLKQEGISYIAAAELPCVIVNIMRGGPGLGGIHPSQSDYFQATKGGGHGDYHLVVLAPASVQEMADFTMDAFEIADRYRNPVMILSDGMLGQMMEPICINEEITSMPEKPWATTGNKNNTPINTIKTLFIEPEVLEQRNIMLQNKYDKIKAKEIKYELYNCENPDIVTVAYGTASRIVSSAIDRLKKEGIEVGMIRPISLWPFPQHVFDEIIEQNNPKAFLTIELSMGQMVEDVRLAVNGKKKVYFYGRAGGIIPTPDEIITEIKKILEVHGCEKCV